MVNRVFGFMNRLRMHRVRMTARIDRARLKGRGPEQCAEQTHE
jgi:hypothetical protein